MIITSDDDHWKMIGRCSEEHGEMLERVTSNGMACLKCKYTIINGVFKKL